MRACGAVPDIARGAHDPPRPCLNRKRKTVAAAVPAAIAGDTPATTVRTKGSAVSRGALMLLGNLLYFWYYGRGVGGFGNL